MQADEAKIGSMQGEMDKLLRKLLVKFVLMRHVRGADLQQVKFSDKSMQLDDDTIAVGVAARSLLSEDHIAPRVRQQFPANARSFYEATVKKMVEKFPFGDQTLADLVILDVTKRADFTSEHVIRLAQQYAPSVDQEVLKDEWEDFQLLEDKAIRLLDGKGQPRRLDVVWSDILNIQTSFGSSRYPELSKLRSAILCLPHSNADCERAFSVVRKIHTEYRKSLGADTLTAFLQ